jgi:hypothetical protein
MVSLSNHEPTEILMVSLSNHEPADAGAAGEWLILRRAQDEGFGSDADLWLRPSW